MAVINRFKFGEINMPSRGFPCLLAFECKELLQRNLQEMWSESYSVNTVNLTKNLLRFQKYRIFPIGDIIWCAPCNVSCACLCALRFSFIRSVFGNPLKVITSSVRSGITPYKISEGCVARVTWRDPLKFIWYALSERLLHCVSKNAQLCHSL